MIQNIFCQAKYCPNQAPKGTPKDRAIGYPTPAIASARPCKCVGTKRRA